MEAGRTGNCVRVLAEPNTAVSESGFEGVDVGKGLVGGDLTQQRPADRPGRCRFVQDEVLSGVELRGVGRQENELEVVRHGELRRAVPGSAV